VTRQHLPRGLCADAVDVTGQGCAVDVIEVPGLAGVSIPRFFLGVPPLVFGLEVSHLCLCGRTVRVGVGGALARDVASVARDLVEFIFRDTVHKSVLQVIVGNLAVRLRIGRNRARANVLSVCDVVSQARGLAEGSSTDVLAPTLEPSVTREIGSPSVGLLLILTQGDFTG